MDANSGDDLFASRLDLLYYEGEVLTRENLFKVFDEIATSKHTATGSIDITLNGTYDVTNAAQVKVNVPSTYTAPFAIRNLTGSEGTVTLTPTKDGVATTDFQSPIISLKVSIDNGATWTEYNELQATTTFTLPAYGRLMFDGSSIETWCNNSLNGWNFKANVAHSLEGSMQSIISSTTKLPDYAFSYLFYGDTNLMRADELVLPWSSVGSYALSCFFEDCTNLTTVPAELPASILAEYCYAGMFANCVSLTTAPELPATTLVDSCYKAMFLRCKNLNSIKVGALTWNTSYASEWVYGVSSTGTFTKPSALTISTGSSGVPSGWTIINEN